MPPHYLLGPVPPDQARRWQPERDAGRCLTFDAKGDADILVGLGESWADVLHKLPAGWRPDFVALHLNYITVPKSLWLAPVPVVGLATDWNLLWHSYRH